MRASRRPPIALAGAACLAAGAAPAPVTASTTAAAAQAHGTSRNRFVAMIAGECFMDAGEGQLRRRPLALMCSVSRQCYIETLRAVRQLGKEARLQGTRPSQVLRYVAASAQPGSGVLHHHDQRGAHFLRRADRFGERHADGSRTVNGLGRHLEAIPVDARHRRGGDIGRL